MNEILIRKLTLSDLSKLQQLGKRTFAETFASENGKKVGQQLYEKAMETAHRKNVDYVWLGVWEKNSRAIRFYEKNGFVAFDKHVFHLGNDQQTDIMMKLQMNK